MYNAVGRSAVLPTRTVVTRGANARRDISTITLEIVGHRASSRQGVDRCVNTCMGLVVSELIFPLGINDLGPAWLTDR